MREVAEKENLLVSGKKLLTYTSTDELESHEKGPWSWDQQEVKALVMFILFHCKGDSWPSHKRMEMWEEAGRFIKMKSGSLHQRSGI